MKVVLLAGSSDEARHHARSAKVPEWDMIIPGADPLGVMLSFEDLVVEFASFATRPDRLEVLGRVQEAIVGSPPHWERIGDRHPH